MAVLTRSRFFVGTLLAALVVCCGPGCAANAQQPESQPVRELSQGEREQLARHSNELHSEDPDVRRQAAVALLAMNHPDALSIVLSRLRTADDPAARVSIIRAAAFAVDHRLFDAVLNALNDPAPEVQAAAAEALARFTRDQEVAAMVEFLERPDATQRQRRLLFTAFGRGVALRAVPVLLEGLKAENEETRTAAVQALQRISGREYGPDLEKWRTWWLTNSHRDREDLLEDHLQALRRQMESQKARIEQLSRQQEELLALVQLPQTAAVGELLSALQSQHQAVRQYAAHRLAELDPEKINGLQLDLRDFEVLGQLLEEGDAPVRRDATGFIAALEPGPHRAALVMEALEDEDPQVVVNAINAVTPATGLAAVRRLGTLLKSSPHADVREAAANAMGKVGDRESVPALVAALDDSAENVRWFAVESLRKLGAKEAVPALQEVLKEDDSARVREIAASALGALGQPGSIPALRDALDDPNERVQQKASAALLALAKDDYDSMALVADVFAERDLLVPSAQVLGRIIEQFSDKEGMDERVARAYAKLADILQRQEDWAGAARALEKLMTLKPDDQAVHGQYVAALIQAGETARVVASFEKRLAAAADPVPVVSRALDAVELMIAAEKTEDARKLLEVAARSLGEEAPEDVQTRLEQLKTRLEAPAVE